MLKNSMLFLELINERTANLKAETYRLVDSRGNVTQTKKLEKQITDEVSFLLWLTEQSKTFRKILDNEFNKGRDSMKEEMSTSTKSNG